MVWSASVASQPAMEQNTRSLMPVRTQLCCAAIACIVLCCMACAGAAACDNIFCEPSTCIALVPLWLSPYFTFCALIAHVLANSARHSCTCTSCNHLSISPSQSAAASDAWHQADVKFVVDLHQDGAMHLCCFSPCRKLTEGCIQVFDCIYCTA